MLSQLTRKICPFVSLAIATIGCGKKIAEPATEGGSINQNQELPSALVLQLDSTRTTYDIARNGVIMIPDRLFVRQGSGSGKRVQITYNLEEDDWEGDLTFKCTYFTNTQTETIPLEDCSSDRGSFGDVSDQKFSIYYGHQIKMEFTSGDPTGTIIDATYSVDWK